MTTATDKKTFRILFADKFAPDGPDFIASQPDCAMEHKPGLSEDELAAIVGEYDGIVVRSGVQVTDKVLANPGNLRVIARAGVGVDNIDLNAATGKGILVMNSAEASTISTAEHAFALMMALCRNIGPAYKTMAEGGWDRSKFTGHQLAGKTLGLVGFGRIGRTVAERAIAFGMDVLAFDPFINASTMLDGKVKMYNEFIDMLPHVDIVSFHVPLNDHTRGMLGKGAFAKAKKGLLVVNAARGGVVDEGALIEALDSGQCGGAALDVYPEEPPADDDPIRKHPKILTTPHLGASTKEAQKAVSVSAAEQLLQYLRGEGIRGAVNAGGLKVDLDPLQSAFVDLADRMAQIISPMVTRGVAQISFDLSGAPLGAAAETIERMALVALLRDQLTESVNIINCKNVAESRGIKTKVSTSEDGKTPQLVMEIEGPSGAIDPDTHPKDKTRRIVGRVYEDMRPRIVEINGYHMDMIPAGAMVLIQNEDRPGVIGLVGTCFGEAGVNIADMAISRRDDTALMLLKVDGACANELLDELRSKPGILKIASVKLPTEK